MSKPVFLLDLDQTLISAEPSEEYDFRKNKEKAKLFKHHDMDGYYIVFERPGLQDFLSFLFTNFEVSIWTAATKDYALFVIDKIILEGHPERKINYVFFSYHCDISKDYGKGTKDIDFLSNYFCIQHFSLKNSIILDDYDEVYETQPQNCIIAAPFEFTDENSENDDFLPKLQKKLEDLVTNFKNTSEVSSSIDFINKKEGEHEDINDQ